MNMQPPEPPECPNCGEELPTDYLGRLDRKRAMQHVCNLPEEPPKRSGWLRFILFCSIMALLGVLLARFVFGVSDETRGSDTEPRDILIADHLHGHWLTIARINHKEPGGEFNPNWTYIKLEPPIIPVVKKRGGAYYVEFTTELTRDLP